MSDQPQKHAAGNLERVRVPHPMTPGIYQCQEFFADRDGILFRDMHSGGNCIRASCRQGFEGVERKQLPRPSFFPHYNLHHMENRNHI